MIPVLEADIVEYVQDCHLRDDNVNYDKFIHKLQKSFESKRVQSYMHEDFKKDKNMPLRAEGEMVP